MSQKLVKDIIDEAVAQTGWNSDTIVEVLTEYIENQKDNATFADYIEQRVIEDLTP